MNQALRFQGCGEHALAAAAEAITYYDYDFDVGCSAIACLFMADFGSEQLYSFVQWF